VLDLTVSADINGVPIPMETRADLEAFYRVLGQYLRWSAQPSAVLVAKDTKAELIKPLRSTNKPSFGGRNPKLGERTIDYAIAALEKYPGGLTAIQVVLLMEESGWKTASKNPIRIVQLTFWSNKDRFFSPCKGKWALRQSQNSKGEE
jgi:hypothetical protein